MAKSRRYCVDCGARLVYFDNLSITKTANEKRILTYGCIKCSHVKGKPVLLQIMRVKTSLDFIFNLRNKIDSNFRCFMRLLDIVSKPRFIKILKNNDYRREKRRFDKYTVLSHYSNGVPRCSCCGITDIRFLTMDHIEGRKLMNHDKTFSGHRLYQWIINNFFPKGFQCLCFNCNIVKGLFGKCSHEEYTQVNGVQLN